VFNSFGIPLDDLVNSCCPIAQSGTVACLLARPFDGQHTIGMRKNSTAGVSENVPALRERQINLCQGADASIERLVIAQTTQHAATERRDGPALYRSGRNCASRLRPLVIDLPRCHKASMPAIASCPCRSPLRCELAVALRRHRGAAPRSWRAAQATRV
jgi:hypothetical protein